MLRIPVSILIACGAVTTMTLLLLTMRVLPPAVGPDYLWIGFFAPPVSTYLLLHTASTRARLEFSWQALTLLCVNAVNVDVVEGAAIGWIVAPIAAGFLTLVRYTVIRDKIIQFTKADYDRARHDLTSNLSRHQDQN